MESGHWLAAISNENGQRSTSCVRSYFCPATSPLDVRQGIAHYSFQLSADTEQRKLAAIMFTDMVGYSALSQRNDKLAQELLEEHRQLLREIFPRFKGTEIKTIGDAFMVEFNSALEAAQCAIEIQRTLAKRNADIPPDRRIEVRIGIHIGDVVHRAGDVYGDGVNIASRIEQLANAGGICVSMDVERHTRNALDARFEKLAPTELKNISVPMDLFRIVLPWERQTPEIRGPATVGKLQSEVSKSGVSSARSTWIWAAVVVIALAIGGFLLIRSRSHLEGGAPATPPQGLAGARPSVPEKSIAVMPFENLSEDKANAYFADGIQDEILTRLSKIADLKVISRTSTQHYKSAPENLPEIAKQLGVAHILEGSVQKSADAVRVNVQLIKAANDSHLWADTFDRKLTDIFSVESEVAKAIADQLRAKLTGQEEQVIAAKPTDNPEAYDAYLRGLAYSLKSASTPANTLGAQKYLREGVRLDPKFALAWAVLSYTDARGYRTANLQPTVALREEARQAAETALTLQPKLGEAVHAKGYYHYACLKDYDTAVRYFEEARQLLPNSSRIPESLAYVERRRGQWDRSESYFNEAERLDPRSVRLLSQHALLYLDTRRFPEALRKLDQILNITPDDPDTLVFKANIAQAEGDLQRASALLGPLHPNADNVAAVETQVYQAILERQPSPIIPRLKEILAKPDPTLGYINGELRFWLGWAQELAGDQAGAQESWRQARSELEPFLKEQPDNYALIGDLALTNMGLGDKGSAFKLIDREMAAVPIEKDALDGPAPTEILARVAAQTGEPDRAIAALQKLLVTPYESPLVGGTVPLTPAILRLDPMFDPLRGDPRFEKIVADLAPK
ncbi:MAG TPA: adenylate/guanylate cyclase domain-containing protein [Chthoniobacterales bacterium]|nr:adenylate/guanylate cyclase domain-containing protein [Chthoniobacterales bacterium]